MPTNMNHPRAFVIERITGRNLATHLGVHPNRMPAIVKAFALERRGGTFQIGEILRRVHRIEPVRLPACLTTLKAAHALTEDDGTKVCRIGELVGIDDLAIAVWEAGVCNVTGLAAEYGVSSDHFRKKLKAGAVDLPPVDPIMIGAKRMYRPLDVLLWCRHRIAIDWPSPPAPPAEPKPVRTRPKAAPDDVFRSIMGDTIADLDVHENRFRGPGCPETGDRSR